MVNEYPPAGLNAVGVPDMTTVDPEIVNVIPGMLPVSPNVSVPYPPVTVKVCA
jgi:hypothetical protein